MFSICALSQDDIDSLLSVAEYQKDTNAVNAFIKLGKTYAANDNQKSIEYLNNAIELSKSIDFQNGIAISYKEIGISFYYIGEYDSCVFYFENAYEIFKSLDLIDDLADVLVLQGIIFDTQSKHDKSLEKYFKAIEIYDSLQNLDGLSATYSNIALIFQRQNQLDEAIEYQYKSLEINKKLGNKNNIAISLINIGLVYQDIEEYEKALEVYQEAKEIFKEVHNKQVESALYNNIGLIYNQLKDYKSALKNFEISLILKEELGNRSGIATTYNNIGKIYLEKEDFSKAEEYFKNSLKISMEINIPSEIKNSYHNLYLLYSKLSNYKEALINFEKYKNIEDSINTTTYNSEINELQVLFETSEKEKTIKQLNLENQQQKFQNEKQRIIIWIIALGFALIIFFSILIFRALKSKNKAFKQLEIKNQEIENQKNQIEEKNVKLAEQARKLSELDEIKSKFFTNISHEFRTPLTLIIAPIKSLLEKNKNPELNFELEIINNNAQRLLRLINQLLDLSKIDKKSMKLNLKRGNFVSFVRNIFNAFSSYAVDKNIEMDFSSVNEIIIPFDDEKIEKIIINIISNALKFTSEKGKITLNIENIENQIQIVIIDTGKGIPEQELSKIFDRFYMIEHAYETETQGSGIGLSLVKELVEIHRGKISVESEIEKGTKFILQFPIEYPDYQNFITEYKTEKKVEISDLKPSKTIENQAHKGKNKILIVEDNVDMQNFIKFQLNNDYDVFQAFNGQDACEIAEKQDFDLIISDVMMPKMNGFEMVKTLKNNKETSHIPIILLTAKSNEESIIEGLETRADDYMKKPFNTNELKARISNLISNRNELKQKFSKNLNISNQEITTTSIDEQFLDKALKIIEENIIESDFSAEKFAELMNISRSSLHRKLKALTDLSTTEFIRTVKIKKAAQLISAKSGNISEIAYQVGFNNLSYFTKCFKEIMKISPSEFAEK